MTLVEQVYAKKNFRAGIQIPTSAAQGLVATSDASGNVSWSATRQQAALTARGLIAETAPLMANATSNAALTSQQIFCSLIGLAANDVITNIRVLIQTAAVGAAPTLIKLAVVSKAGVVLQATGNLNADAKWTSTGYKDFPLSSPYSVTATDGYYIAALQNGPFATTQPQVVRTGNTVAPANTAPPSGVRMFASGGTGQTDITGTLTLADGGSGTAYWFGVN